MTKECFQPGRPLSGLIRVVMAMAAMLLLASCSPRRAAEAQLLLGDLAAGDGPSRLKSLTPDPHRQTVIFDGAGRRHMADLYSPGGEEEALAAMVVVPGVAEAGREDQRLAAMARTLARVRFRVLVPDVGELRELKVSREDARDIARAVRYLSARERERRPGRRGKVGLSAISYAAGPALLAALEEGVGDRLAFILAIGGYYHMDAVITFFTTGYYRRHGEDGPWRYRRPNDYGKWVFVLGNLERVADKGDRALLESMARRRLKDTVADIDDLAVGLKGEGRAVHALLANADPDKVPALIEALPAAIREEVAALDLKRRDWSGLAPRVILIHGRDDPIIPASESEALLDALPKGRAELHLVANLAHVDLGFGGVPDFLRLWRAAYRLLEERDRLGTEGN